MLVLEDPGGDPLDALLGTAARARRISLRSPSGWQRRCDSFTGAASSTRTSSRRTCSSTRTGNVRLTGFGIASRLPRERQAPDAAGGHRRHACLHGARADRPHEPLDRRAQRSLLARRHLLRDAHRHTAVHGRRSDGVDPLPHRPAADAAERAGAGHSRIRRGDRPEAARQDRGGPLPDRRRRRGRPAAVPGGMGGARTHRAVPARRARRARTGC